MRLTERPPRFDAEPPPRAPLPYGPAEAATALEWAGYEDPAVGVLAAREALTASWVIQIAATQGEDALLDVFATEQVDTFWRLLRLADNLAVGDDDPDDPDDDDNDGRGPTVGDVLALVVRARVWSPTDTPVLVRGLTALGLDGMAAAVAATTETLP